MSHTIDIIIPVNQATTWAYEELRYTLRSFEMYCPEIGNVYIIGHKPTFVQNVIHVPFREKSMYPATNLYQKLKVACEMEEVSELFIYAHDDHFLLPGYVYDAAYCEGDLEDELRREGDPIYKRTVRNTLEFLLAMPEPKYRNFDVNVPMAMSKKAFLTAMAQVNWERNWGYCIKSLYGNMYDILPARIEDCKIRSPKPYDYLRDFIKDKPGFSSGMRINDDFKKLLTELYPNKSKYEQ